MPSRERFIGRLGTGAREERRSPEGFGITVGACAGADAGADAGAGAGVGAEAAAGAGDGAYGVGWRERPGPRGGSMTRAGLGATGVDIRALGAARNVVGMLRFADDDVCARVTSVAGGGSGGGNGVGGLEDAPSRV